MDKNVYLTDTRFKDIEPFKNKIWLSSPTMHGDEQKWVDEAIQTNWVSTVGANIDEVERMVAEKVGREYAVALSSGTAALHLAVKLCGEKLYGQARIGHGVLEGKKVFCSDMTFDATVNPVAYEGGEAVFIDTEYDTWNMDPEALKKAFEIYPDVKLIVVAHLYGTPGKIDEIKAIADKHGALIVEDAAESFGATYNGIQTGKFGDVSILSANGNKIITGSSGGFLLTDNLEWANKARKWSTQSRENALWYQHEELGYNYRMSNIIAGVLRGQIPYMEEHIAQKKAIYERYREGLKDLPVTMNPVKLEGVDIEANYWLSCILIDKEAMSIPANGIETKVKITLLRNNDPELQQKEFTLNLILKESEDLAVVGQNKFSITYSDIHPEYAPSWWVSWAMPPYRYDVAQKFFELFYAMKDVNPAVIDEMVTQYGDYFVNASSMMGPLSMYSSFMNKYVLIPLYEYYEVHDPSAIEGWEKPSAM